jgi:hypothetical protein
MTNEEIFLCVARAVIYFVMIWIVSDFHYDYRKHRERKDDKSNDKRNSNT